jgi:hypothetical protein
MNHGAPAATTARSGNSGSKIRSPATSCDDRSSNAPNRSSSVDTTGSRRFHSSRRSDGIDRSTGCPQRYRGVISISPITGVTCMQAAHRPRGGTITS